MAAAARRVPLEKPPTASDEARIERQQASMRRRAGANIRRLRLELDLSQDQLARRADVSANYIGQLELGRRAVSLDILVRLAHHLGTTVSALTSE